MNIEKIIHEAMVFTKKDFPNHTPIIKKENEKMTKLLGYKACFNRLQKELNKRFTEEEQEVIGYYEDIETERSYTWDCELNGKRFRLACNKKDGKITYKEVNF